MTKILTSLLLSSAATGARSTLRALDPDIPSGAFIAPSGLAQLRGPREPVEVYPSSANPFTAAHRWELTHAILGETVPIQA